MSYFSRELCRHLERLGCKSSSGKYFDCRGQVMATSLPCSYGEKCLELLEPKLSREGRHVPAFGPPQFTQYDFEAWKNSQIVSNLTIDIDKTWKMNGSEFIVKVVHFNADRFREGMSKAEDAEAYLIASFEEQKELYRSKIGEREAWVRARKAQPEAPVLVETRTNLGGSG